MNVNDMNIELDIIRTTYDNDMEKLNNDFDHGQISIKEYEQFKSNLAANYLTDTQEIVRDFMNL